MTKEDLHKPTDISVGPFRFRIRVLRGYRPLSGEGYEMYLMTIKESGEYHIIDNDFVRSVEHAEQAIIDTEKALNKGHLGIKAVSVYRR